MATCMSPLSRNRTVGERLARSHSIERITSDMNMVAEGQSALVHVTEASNAGHFLSTLRRHVL